MMPSYESSPAYEHGATDSLGVLLVNLGTPDAPTTSAVRRYLAEFLWDPRVVEVPRPIWWLILHGFILRFRPSRSAHAYQQIWTPDGSPLLLHCQAIAQQLQSALSASLSGKVSVALGMSYGNPSLGHALDQLHQAGARRLIVLPLYPQYSGTTTASVFDAVTHLLRKRRWLPEFRFINQYHDDDAYIRALADSIRKSWQKNGRGDKLLFSFHGVPRQTLLDGDPYHCQCQKTARLVAESLRLGDNEWQVSFQSRVGRAEWLRPYTDETMQTLGSDGVGQLDVVCPGFSVDCLETLEEIAMQNADLFAEAGGKALNYIPCLNAGSDHVSVLTSLLQRHIAGWPEAGGDVATTGDTAASRQRALAAGAER